jgi:hypothetical protein
MRATRFEKRTANIGPGEDKSCEGRFGAEILQLQRNIVILYGRHYPYKALDGVIILSAGIALRIT